MNLRKNFIYVLFTVVSLMILITFVYSVLTKKTGPTFLPNPTPRGPVSGLLYNGPTSTESAQKNSAIIQLIKSLPYQGRNFSLSYNYSNFIFNLTLYKRYQQAGEDEFKLYLNKFGIPDKSWLRNLVTKVY